MKDELVSIVIPAYKAEKYIDRCLNSLACQTYKNIEIIIVNDGSPDNTGKMLDDWAKKDNRIKVIHKQNGGVSSARNEGLKAVSGKYTCFVDIDDEVKPDYVNLLYKAITEYNTDVAMCSLLAERKKGLFLIEGMSETKNFDIHNKLDEFANVLINGVFMPPYCKLYKTEKISEGFPEYTNYGEDEIFNLQYFSKIKNIVVIPEALYVYYLNDASLCRQKNTLLFKKRADTVQIKYKLLLEIFATKPEFAGYFASKSTIRQAFGIIGDFLKEKKSTKEIVSILNELISNENVQFALKIYPKLDKKTTLVWKCLSKKQFKKLIFLRKIKMLFSK